MENYIITFGQIHAHRVNGTTFDKDSVAVVCAKSYTEARKFAFSVFKNEFRQCIEESAFDKSGSIAYYPRGKFKAN